MERRTLLKSIVYLPLMPTFLGFSYAHAASRINIRELYNSRKITDLAYSLEGKEVIMRGFMAPPLLAESKFFVLTTIPMATCPFCSDIKTWPDDIITVYTKKVVRPVAFSRPIYAIGKLAIGEYTDEDTGFVSLLRLTNATFKNA